MQISTRVGHCDDYNSFAFDAVDQRVRKPVKQTPECPVRFPRPQKDMFLRVVSIEIVKEIHTGPRLFPFKPENSVINFLLSECEESDFQLPFVLTH